MLNYLNQILVQLNLRLRHRNEPELADMNNGTHQAVPTRFTEAKTTNLVREIFTSNFWMSGLAMLSYILSGIVTFSHMPRSFRVKQVDGMAFFTESKHGEVDLCPSLAAMLKEYVGLRTSGLLFCTSTGAQLLQANTLQDSLHPILDEMKHVKGGFNIFRRFRITHLEKSDCPEALKHLWSGHAPAHVSERYVKLLNDRAYRLD